MLKSVITGTGACIPEVIQYNTDFVKHAFFDEKGNRLDDTETVIRKFRKITGIEERRYASQFVNTSDMAAAAAKEAILDSGCDPESIDQIVVAHNFGDLSYGSLQSCSVPSLASKVKHQLRIARPECIAYDVLVGCPGWIHSVIQSHAWFLAGMAKKVLLIGAETLSRILDPADRDSMIFADGAGACVLEAKESGTSGILSTCALTHALGEVDYIEMGKSYKRSENDRNVYLKMNGRKVYEYALKNVPAAMKLCLDRASVNLAAVSKILIHQANEKMDEEIVTRLFSICALPVPTGILPMSIQWLGNSSVATVPTLFHLIRHGKLTGHSVAPNDVILFASVGAGMNINAVCYRV
jgi:3-oxoacyl-[acyl-carrier-protein] synthase-3